MPHRNSKLLFYSTDFYLYLSSALIFVLLLCLILWRTFYVSNVHISNTYNLRDITTTFRFVNMYGISTYTNISHTIRKCIYDKPYQIHIPGSSGVSRRAISTKIRALLSIVVWNSQIQVSVLLGYEAVPPDGWSLKFLRSCWSHLQGSKCPPICFIGPNDAAPYLRRTETSAVQLRAFNESQ